jgi:hypothetical protein
MKKLLITTLLAAAAAFQAYGQGVGPGPTPDPFYQPRALWYPSGPPGTYNFPAIIHANLGELTYNMGGYGLGDDSRWFKVVDWYNQHPSPPSETPYYDDNGTQHTGQFLVKYTIPPDYNLNLYMVIDSLTGEKTYFRIIPGHAIPPPTDKPGSTDLSP